MGKTYDIDPEISSLLGIEDTESNIETKTQECEEGKDKFLDQVLKVENKELINQITNAKKIFDDKNNKQERATTKVRLANIYQNLYSELALKVINGKLSYEQLLCLRFNLIDRNYISDSQFKIIKTIASNVKHPYIYYIDEWVKGVGTGKIEKSITDETVSLKKPNEVIDEKLRKRQGQKESEIAFIKSKTFEIKDEEEKLKRLVEEAIHRKQDDEIYKSIKDLKPLASYSKEQKQSIVQIFEACRKLIKKDKELAITYNNFHKIEKDIESLTDRNNNTDQNKTNIIKEELIALRQMTKMTVGKQGNHFPILLKQYFTETDNEIASKENVQKIIKHIEEIDCKIFNRVYKGTTNKVAPYCIILPCYGDKAVCWEAIPRHNRATGKGTIAIPLLPRKLFRAVIHGLADLRWQVAKERAAHRWMEEGLTGQYYGHYEKEKLKGNIKDLFIEDYTTWIEYESKGALKLHKEVRKIFWRLLPFNEKLKEELSNKGYIYSDLYVKDKLREQSRGY